MTTRRRPLRTASEQHRAWLELVDQEGPFLAIPPLKRAWPQGMPALPTAARARLVDAKPAFEKAWDAWDRDPQAEATLTAYRTARDAWVDVVVREVFGWGELLVTGDDAAAVRSGARATSPDRTVAVEPTGALVHGDTCGALLWVIDPVAGLRDLVDDGWAASPVDRMEAMLRASGVPIGVVTDGRWWGLVCARPKAMVASGIVDAQTWVEEEQARDAFAALLQVRSLVGGRAEDRLAQLFAESVAAAEEITESLGVQVRRAVELLVEAFAESAADARAAGVREPLPADPSAVYEAAVTVLMRVVFLLFAEERGLLPQGQLYAGGYGLTDQLDALDERARHEGEEALDGTAFTWHRLLATSQALFRGATFEDLRLPAYGGSLFDPGRFPFMSRLTDRGTLAVTVNDRVLLHVLRAVQVAHLRGQDARRISFRDIDVEQIGYIYEGLLGYTCRVADEVTVGLVGKQGAEPEIPLDVLDGFAEEHERDEQIAAAIVAWAKEHQPASVPQTANALARALRSGDAMEDAERAVLSVTRDPELGKRLRGWIGVIRRDLRGRPVVVQPGGLLVVETPSRRNAGAHYTPRSLAEEVVHYALEPLVYRPGPHQTADRSAWRPVSSDDLLSLKVADIACGSGAFLVAAARYLAARLVEAWHREGTVTLPPHQLEVDATRKVVATCLYGADINAMAVEMGKLSLWLVSLDRNLPFSFVDDKILCGNSLLGITDLRQLETLHITPPTGHQQQRWDVDARGELVERLDLDHAIARAVRLRQALASEIDDADPQRSATAKARQWKAVLEATEDLSTVADGVVAAGLALGGKPGRALDEAYDNLRVAVDAAYPSTGAGDPTMLDAIIDRGLTPTVATDYERWQPLHWPLVVADVMRDGGFHAVIGNPPFLGGKKISGTSGSNLREWLVNVLAGGVTGHADLVAYFFHRASTLLRDAGTLGLIATNTVGQGDTREVGLDRMVENGFTITRAIQSRPWPAASANLEYAAVWGTVGLVRDAAERVADDVVVRRVSSLLEPGGAVGGTPARLRENIGVSFIGCYVLGMGFVLDAAEAQAWIERDKRNSEVLFPYINGDDLNSRSDCTASRWAIDFNARSMQEAARFKVPFDRVESRVLPERRKVNRKVHRERWWQYADKRPALRKAIARLHEVLAITRHSGAVMPVRVPTGQVFSDALAIFATDSFADQAVVSCSLHQTWAIAYGSTLGTGVRYAPSDVFETFPRPAPTDWLDAIGRTLEEERREIMLRRQLGLTKLYNLVNDPDISDAADSDVARMRAIHVELDEAVMAAYGWSDLPLDHGFHTYRQMQRWTVSPAARVEILDRLLAENHRRAALQGGNAPAAAENEDEEEP